MQNGVFENLGENLFERWQLQNSKIKKVMMGGVVISS
jgi:hypothetical protein